MTQIVIFTDEEIKALANGEEVRDLVNPVVYMNDTAYRNSRLKQKIDLERRSADGE